MRDFDDDEQILAAAMREAAKYPTLIVEARWLFLDFRRGEAGAHERIIRWICQSPRHAAAFLYMKKLELLYHHRAPHNRH